MTAQPLKSNGTKTGLDATLSSTLSSLGVESRLGTNFTSAVCSDFDRPARSEKCFHKHTVAGEVEQPTMQVSSGTIFVSTPASLSNASE